MITESRKKKALVIEDLREADEELESRNYDVTRITHNELMASAGETYNARLPRGEYDLLWISTPGDHYVRTPGKRCNPHWQRIQTWMKRAADRQIHIVVYGPPGFLWKLPNFRETMEELQLSVRRLRLCHFNEKFDRNDTRPSGTYLQVASSMPLPRILYPCNCRLSIPEHALDWYGQNPKQAEWRKRVSRDMVRRVCDLVITSNTNELSRDAVLEVHREHEGG